MAQPQYSYLTLNNDTCTRCNQTINSGWLIDGKLYGPTCGKVILRKAGIKWSAKFGPGSFDPAAMRAAVELARFVDAAKQKRQQYDYEAVKSTKITVGSIGWKVANWIATRERTGMSIKLSPDAQRCYEAANSS